MSSSIEGTHTAEFDRAAVIAIQGGGVFGLSMLGQLSAVLEAGIVPMAWSGTSAGAIVATLAWAGYSPKEIREMFVSLTYSTDRRPVNDGARLTLVDLVGPFGERSWRYDYSRFRAFAAFFITNIDRFIPAEKGEPRRKSLVWWRRSGLVQAWGAVIGCFVFAGALVAGAGLWLSGTLTTLATFLLLGAVFVVTACLVCWRIIHQFWRGCLLAFEFLRHPWPQRGFFSGDSLEHFINEKLRESPELRRFREELGSEPLTFRRIAALRAAHRGGELPGFAPLILTATDLGRRELVLIASFDQRYGDFPIAKAVRASAGFPVFFRPVDFTSESCCSSYVDGGVIANYPAWVFSRELRRALSGTSDYRPQATRPWLNIGLRMAYDSDTVGVKTPGGFARAMFDLVRGRARDQLEKALASPLPRTLTIDQPIKDSGAPEHILDIQALNEDKIRAMFLSGHEHAREKLRLLSFALPGAGSGIDAALSRLCEEVNLILGEKSNGRFSLRANVYMPWEDELILRYEINMGQDRDRTLRFTAHKGLTGTCYLQRRPYLCNLEILRAWANVPTVDPNETQLGMVPWEHLAVRDDRTWLMNVPIFDPQDSWFLDELPERTTQAEDAIWTELQIDRDGAVLGVLNIDGAIPYGALGIPSNPEVALTEVKIRCILATLWSCSTDLGRILSSAFAAERKDHGTDRRR